MQFLFMLSFWVLICFDYLWNEIHEKINQFFLFSKFCLMCVFYTRSNIWGDWFEGVEQVNIFYHNQPHPGGILNEKRKLIAIPPKQRKIHSWYPWCWISSVDYALFCAICVAWTTPYAEDLILPLSKLLEAEDGDKRPLKGH